MALNSSEKTSRGCSFEVFNGTELLVFIWHDKSSLLRAYSWKKKHSTIPLFLHAKTACPVDRDILFLCFTVIVNFRKQVKSRVRHSWLSCVWNILTMDSGEEFFKVALAMIFTSKKLRSKVERNPFYLSENI